MSRYDDPKWYEEQNNSNYNPAQPEQPQHEDFDSYPFLPSSETNQASDIDNSRYAAAPPRFQRILRQILTVSAFVLIAFFAGWFSHQQFGNQFNQNDKSRAYEQLFQQAWEQVDQNYVDRKAVDYRKMSYAAIQAMVDSLGDKGHSRFLDPQTVQNENQSLSGKFTGIGIYLHQDATSKDLIIDSAIPGSPAEAAGFKHGDVIIAVNDTSVVGKSVSDVSPLIQGAAGTSVKITIKRANAAQPLSINVKRAEIVSPNVILHYISESHIAHIQVTQFSSDTGTQAKEAINKAKGMGATKIILDLRNNPGGYLDEATNVTSLFVKSGNVLLEQDKNGQRTPVPVSGNAIDTTDQIVVLVNENSASAAEIVTGALQDHQRATIIGVRTFGTGTVLTQIPLADGSAVLLGIQEWLTPNGHFIRSTTTVQNGIKPDIEVKQGPNDPLITPNDENQANMNEQQILSGGDAQLAAAIQFLNGHK